MTTIDTPKDVSPLYAAATEALVSDASSTSTFEKMIAVAYSHSSSLTFGKELKQTEAQIKKDYEITTMPIAWRSAKSIVRSAVNLGIKLVDDNGGFYGKTNLQNKIKDFKAKATPEKELTANDYADKVIAMIHKIPTELLPEAIPLIAEVVSAY